MRKIAYIISATLVTLLPTHGVLAATPSKGDRNSVNNQAEYHSSQSSGSCTTGSIPSSVNLPKSTVDAINALKDDYMAAEEEGVPWQFMAAAHYRENKNDPNTSPLAGEPLGSPNPDHPGLVINTVREGAIEGAKIMKSNARGVYGVEIKKNNSVEELAKIFVAYNRGYIYKQRGIDPKKSPYAMNFFDNEHQRMSWPPNDGSAGGVDLNLGAVTVYMALAGADGGSCAGSSSGNKVVDIAREELAKNVKENPDGCNCGGRIDIYTDKVREYWCADFVSWVYKEAGQPFSGGLSGGWRLPGVAGIKSWLESKGTWINNGSDASTPQPGDAVAFDHSGDEVGNDTHIGIVEKVEGSKLITIEGNTSNQVARREYPNYKSDNTIMGWGRP